TPDDHRRGPVLRDGTRHAQGSTTRGVVLAKRVIRDHDLAEARGRPGVADRVGAMPEWHAVAPDPQQPRFEEGELPEPVAFARDVRKPEVDLVHRQAGFGEGR